MKNASNVTLLSYTIIAVLIVVSCNNGTQSEKIEHTQKTGYACPMHPEVTGEMGEKCSKCGMELERVQKNFQMVLASQRNTQSGQAVSLSFIPRDKDDLSKKVELDVQHEKKFHLIVVSADLAWFDHIHPEYRADGSYSVTETFPHGGNFLLFADYKPAGNIKQVEKIPLTISGKPSNTKIFTEPDLSETADDYKVTITNGNDLQTNRKEHIAISIENDGRQLKEAELQKYLGASAHIVMIDTKDKDFMHIHPGSSELVPIYAEATFSKPGIYRIWVQFQINNKLYTTDFVVKVIQGSEKISGKKESHSNHTH